MDEIIFAGSIEDMWEFTDLISNLFEESKEITHALVHFNGYQISQGHELGYTYVYGRVFESHTDNGFTKDVTETGRR